MSAFGMGVWKEILKQVGWCWEKLAFKVGKGNKISIWTDLWCGDTVLSQRFLHLFTLAAHRNATIEEMWDQNFGVGGWNLRFIRDFNDWELDMVGNLFHDLRGHKITLEEDSVFWKEGRNWQFRVKEAYSLLDSPLTAVFPKNKIWVERVPTKIVFFAWETA